MEGSGATGEPGSLPGTGSHRCCASRSPFLAAQHQACPAADWLLLRCLYRPARPARQSSCRARDAPGPRLPSAVGHIAAMVLGSERAAIHCRVRPTCTRRCRDGGVDGEHRLHQPRRGEGDLDACHTDPGVAAGVVGGVNVAPATGTALDLQAPAGQNRLLDRPPARRRPHHHRQVRARDAKPGPVSA